jgi:hypothetical protein
MDAAGVAFPAMNLAGSLLICVSLAESFNLPSALIEVFWIAISVYGLARALAERRPREIPPERPDG